MPLRSISKFLAPGLLLASLAAAAPAHAANDPAPLDTWVRWLGSPQEATVRSLDFLGPILFAGSEADGIFSSPTVVGPWGQDNGGLDSQEAKSVRQVKVSPNGQVYAATSAGLFSSPAGTGNWTQVGGGPGNHKLNMGGIQSIMFDDPTGLSMTVAVAGAGGPGVYNTTDGGVNWDRATSMPAGENVYQLTSGPAQIPMYAAADDGVFASPDFGHTWKLISDGIPPGETTLRVAVSPSNPLNMLATTSSSVYSSSTGGIKWSEAAGKDDAQLPAGGKRALLLLPPINGKPNEVHALVGTEDGVWGTLDGGDHWGPMSPSTKNDSSHAMKDRIVWSLGYGFSPASIMAGTSGFGVFSILPTPMTTGAPTITPKSAAKIPAGTVLKITNLDPKNEKYMGFDGMRPYTFTYQWYRCSTASSSDCGTVINGANDPTYTIPKNDAGHANYYYAVKVTGKNLLSATNTVVFSNVNNSGVADDPDDKPTLKLNTASLTSPAGPDALGKTYTIHVGTWTTTNAGGMAITPKSYSYRWERCFFVCSTISGATGSTYTATGDDIGGHINAYVSAVGPAAKGSIPSDEYLVDQTLSVQNVFPVNTVKPKIVGDAYTGATLSSSAGGFKGYNMTFERRWFRCEEDGLGCNPLQFPAQTDSTYTVKAADKGYRLELEVTAIGADPNQNRKTVVFSAQTAVITDPPPPAPADPTPGAGGNGGGDNGGGNSGGGNGNGQGNGQGQGQGQTPFSVPVSLPKKVKSGATLSVPTTMTGFKTITYQWLRNGKKIRKATKAKYKLTKSDKGKKISCLITLTPSSGAAKIIYTTTPIKVPKK